jgi:uncharacterized membrane protein YdfJ with MMPL/SSD domain
VVIGAGEPAIQAQLDSIRRFGLPLLTLMLGITTGLQHLLPVWPAATVAGPTEQPGATREAVAEYLAIVLTAGVTVATGVAALAVAESKLFHAFGPGLAVAVLVGLVVAVVLVPALLGVLGRWAFWPSGLGPGAASGPAAGASNGIWPHRGGMLFHRHPTASSTSVTTG